jgi:hypothetical protein
MFTAQLTHFLIVHRAAWPPGAHFVYNLYHHADKFPRIYGWAKAHGFVYRP